MKKNILFIIITFLVSSFLISCSSSITLQKSIPFETQQLIKSVEGNQKISFEYIPNEAGNVKDGRLRYSINPAFQNMLNELLQSKFNELTSDATNQIVVTLSEVNTNDDVGTYNVTHNLDMKVNVELVKDGEEMNKNFTYSTSFVLEDPNYERESIENLLLKFIVSIDKFIDTSFKVQ